MSAPTVDVPESPAELTRSPSIGEYFRSYLDRVRGGDIGSLPAVLGLVVLVIVFSIMRPVFLSEGNFANLLTQGAPIVVIAMGLVFVLLLGEIDLSAGFASGVCAAVLATLLTDWGWSWPAAVAVSLLTGLAIGTAIGTLVARVGIPSFVVTLAAFLAFQGMVLLIIGQGGNVPIRDEVILAIENKNLPPLWGWILWAVSIGALAAVTLMRAQRRRAKGLSAEPMAVLGLKIGGLALITGIGVYVLNLERSRNPAVVSLKGVPWVVPIILVLLVVLTFVLMRTAYGRHVYAVGGNAEAARRAGIKVPNIRTSVFMIGSTMAAIGGIIAASRANSVDPNAGGSNTLLYAVGA
ncbi:MAG TPA: ABC transporter permease, partial [Actinomycetes bacterium]|nr:ABC transporter permease [Actinomycetes bacterium]